MTVLGSFATTNNTVATLPYFWWGNSGTGDCNTVNFLERDGLNFGFHYIPTNNSYGTIITTSDQDWIGQSISYPLMENIITHLISPPPNPNSFSIELGLDSLLCHGDTLELVATNSSANYLWQDSSTDSIFKVTQSGSYWVEVNSFCGTLWDTINVSFSPLPNIDLGEDTTLCQGEALILDVTQPGVTYLWQDSSTNSTYNVTSQGLYWVTITDTCGSTTDSINVYYRDLLDINIGNDTTLCDGELLFLDLTYPYASYQWQDNSTDSTFEIAQQGLYWVVATDSCGSSTDSIVVSYSPLPSVNLGNDTTLCNGENLTLDVTQTNVTYQWQDGSTNATFNVTSQGFYWVTLTDTCGSTTDSIYVSYAPLPSVSLGNDTTLCQGVVLSLDVTAPFVTYSWQDNSSGATFDVSQTGEYWVNLTDTCGSNSDTIMVTFNPIPTVNLGNDTTLCHGMQVMLNASTTDVTYLWQDNSTNMSYNVSNQGLYWVTVTDTCGSFTDSIYVDYAPLPSVNLGNDTTLCEGETLLLDVQLAASSYLWSNNSVDSFLEIESAGLYWVTLTDTCGSNSDSITVNYNPLSTENIDIDTVFCHEESVTLDVTFPGASYLWDDNSTNSSNTFAVAGSYWVEVSLANCSFIKDINVAEEDCEIILELPNVFTPDMDGVNDLFVPVISKGITSMTTAVLNRWGNIIFESNDLLINWNGEGLSGGTYFWIVNYKDVNGSEGSVSGHVTLFR